MGKDYLEIGGNPPSEDLLYDVSSPEQAQRSECRAYITALRRKLGPEPEGAELFVKGNRHDFGTYYEVVCKYDPDNEVSANYAFACESDGPQTWEEVGMKVTKTPDESGVEVIINN